MAPRVDVREKCWLLLPEQAKAALFAALERHDGEADVPKIAERVAKLPPELAAINKRSVHRAMEIAGLRTSIRAGTELQALAFQTESSKAYMTRFKRDGGSVSGLLSERDAGYGDYRERREKYRATQKSDTRHLLELRSKK